MKIVLIIILGISFTTSFAQKVYKTADGYVAVDASRVPDSYSEVHDETFAPGGRVKRHCLDIEGTHNSTTVQNEKVSKNFIIAPTDLPTTEGQLTWAEAAGWHLNANTLVFNESVNPAETGCSQYQGKDGKDKKGTWRLPTQRELILMWILKPVLEKKTFVEEKLITPFAATDYFTATEYFYRYGNDVGKLVFVVNFKEGESGYKDKQGEQIKTRCIKDIKPNSQ